MVEGTVRLGRNRLLDTLDRETFQEIQPFLTHVTLQIRDYMYHRDQPMEYAWFPVNGVLSMLAEVEGGTLVEVATVGNEGMIGLPLFLGADLTPGSAFSQVPGEAYKMEAAVFKQSTAKHETFRRLLHRYTQALMVQISQGTACNRMHSLQERCARWLLLTHDRVGLNEFFLTQEFLGQMLGARRATVNLAASTFQEAGYIEYKRGNMTILNRAGLESSACVCYSIIRKEYDRLLNGH